MQRAARLSSRVREGIFGFANKAQKGRRPLGKMPHVESRAPRRTAPKGAVAVFDVGVFPFRRFVAFCFAVLPFGFVAADQYRSSAVSALLLLCGLCYCLERLRFCGEAKAEGCAFRFCLFFIHQTSYFLYTVIFLLTVEFLHECHNYE